MANPLNTATDRKPDELTSQDAAAINYISDTLASNRKYIKNPPRFDELIVSLTNAHENRRARQVSEWERLGGQSLSRAV